MSVKENLKKVRQWIMDEGGLVCPHKFGGCKHDNENCPVFLLDQAISALDEPESRYLKCGCVLCACEDGGQCHGCGAKLCPTHAKECGHYTDQDKPEPSEFTHSCCEPECGAGVCDKCGCCLTEHNEDPVNNCPSIPIHRTTTVCKYIDKLTAELKAAKDLWIEAQTARKRLALENDKLTAENERYEDGLRKIESWSKAYPLTVFPEPDFKKVHEVLKAAGINLDAVSASNMRHVIEGVKDIVKQALEGK